MHALRSGTLSRLDTAKMERGYYENLTDVNRFNSQLWEVYAKKPRNWLEVENAGLKRFVDGFAQTELIPVVRVDHEVRHDHDQSLGHARSGLCAEAWPEYVSCRIARGLVADGLGSGRWRDLRGAAGEPPEPASLPGSPFARYELLNFGVPGYQPPQQLVDLRARAYAASQRRHVLRHRP